VPDKNRLYAGFFILLKLPRISCFPDSLKVLVKSHIVNNRSVLLSNCRSEFLRSLQGYCKIPVAYQTKNQHSGEGITCAENLGSGVKRSEDF
jgi:hypothetical protein